MRNFVSSLSDTLPWEYIFPFFQRKRETKLPFEYSATFLPDNFNKLQTVVWQEVIRYQIFNFQNDIFMKFFIRFHIYPLLRYYKDISVQLCQGPLLEKIQLECQCETINIRLYYLQKEPFNLSISVVSPFHPIDTHRRNSLCANFKYASDNTSHAQYGADKNADIAGIRNILRTILKISRMFTSQVDYI